MLANADEVIEIKCYLLRCMVPLLAQSGHGPLHRTCPLV